MSTAKTDMVEAGHPLYSALKYLKDHNSSEDYWFGVESMEQLLLNVKNNPNDERFRKFTVDEPAFANRIGGLSGNRRLMAAAGFHATTLNGKDAWMMHASADAWSHLLKVGATLHNERKKKKKKSHSSSNSSGGGSRHRSSHKKKNRRASNDSTLASLNDSGKSLFEDEHETDEGLTSASESGGKRSKKKSKKSKKKLSKSASKSKLGGSHGNTNSTSSISPHSSSSSLDERNGDSAGSLTLNEALGTDVGTGPHTHNKRTKKRRNSGSRQEKAPESPKPHRGQADFVSSPVAKSRWSLAASAVVQANRMQSLEADVVANADPRSPKKVSDTATKDYWKAAATQALLMNKMRDLEEDNPANKSSDDGESDMEGNKTDDDNHSVSSRGRWRRRGSLGSKQGDKSSRRSLFSRTASTRSGGSTTDDDDDDGDGSRSTSRHGKRTRRKLKKKVDPMESMRRIQALERGLSKHEVEEHRQMIKEHAEMRAEQRKRLEMKIKREPGPRCTTMLTTVSIITAAELGLDLVTTLISFLTLVGSFECCGNVIDAGALTMGITIPYFVLIVIELTMLACNVRQARANSAFDEERLLRFDEGNLEDLEEMFDDEESWDSDDEYEEAEEKVHFSRIMSWILIANPFLGCLITWVLLYEVQSRNEAFVILALEGGSVVLMFLAVYLEREKLTFCSMLLHGIPLLPFAATCFVVWYYLDRGGICFRDGNFWFDNCGVCGNDPAPPGGLACPDGTAIEQGTFCGEVAEEQFCYFSY